MFLVVASNGLRNCPHSQLRASRTNGPQQPSSNSYITLLNNVLIPYWLPFHTNFLLLWLIWSNCSYKPFSVKEFQHGPHRKHISSVTVSYCCRSNLLHCEAITLKRLSYISLFRRCCLVKGLHVNTHVRTSFNWHEMTEQLELVNTITGM
jgi:hypothetical protein